MINSLSGRFLILTTVFVMLAEILIFVPSIARFREDYLLNRLERAQIASLALLADDMLGTDLKLSFLKMQACLTWFCAVTRSASLMLSSPMPHADLANVDLRDGTALVLIRDAMRRMSTRKRGHSCDRRARARGGSIDRSHDGDGANARGDDRLRRAHS